VSTFQKVCRKMILGKPESDSNKRIMLIISSLCLSISFLNLIRNTDLAKNSNLTLATQNKERRVLHREHLSTILSH